LGRCGDYQVATSVIRRRRKYVVVWNSSVASANKKERDGKVTKAEDGLKKLLESVEKGEIGSRYLHTKGNKKGFSFTIEKTKALDEVEKYDGYQVFVTTEFDFNEKEVLESYRTRD
jgi:hypothetical protein